MELSKLSEQVAKLTNPQKSDAFVRQFRGAVREGIFDAADAPGRFELPKRFSRRGSDETYTRSSREMILSVTPEFEEWFAAVDAELAQQGRRNRPVPTAEAFKSGELDFEAAVEETRRKMHARFEKGQQLGSGRGKGKAKARS